ncbi:1-deoxy-D-xylulose-5-phosphate reductoisomerase [Candidatus Bipolaricaulota bacterium]|nr:1-deoxy-D-xylulose-5-phosphate reductoisomerase [Candidatus Bipolaricaulota bacterium]MBS3813992.1 1-deoxy-D-xylulose-5-phosphate reductoisomerase [Candidatus Bipolaricaulota bacterium]MBS3825123.1 1-deoxy-D-xylulose-5-phosphate reductoisomerase [Candidatus Bipolaricaulota bacterium]
MAKDVVILGSTGSIGTQTLEVLSSLENSGQESFNVLGLGCGTNVELLASQVKKFHPKVVSVKSNKEREILSRKISREVEIGTGREGLDRLASLGQADKVINALVGFVGLEPTLKAIGNADEILLANKESLVVGGSLVDEKLQGCKTSVIPVDSEHNAIFQALQAGEKEEVEELIITASGGPFLSTPLEAIPEAGPEEALDHPNWDMGSRITCDSASMVNKGLEVIEAHWLFGLPYEQIDTVVHPQSVVHSLVQYRDGSMVAELGEPDMKVPIQYALTYPKRLKNDYERTNLVNLARLEFKDLDPERYPAFEIVVQAGKDGGDRPTAVNGADEALIDLFLDKKIKFGDIARGLKQVLKNLNPTENPTLENLKQTDKWARKKVNQLVNEGKLGGR